MVQTSKANVRFTRFYCRKRNSKTKRWLIFPVSSWWHIFWFISYTQYGTFARCGGIAGAWSLPARVSVVTRTTEPLFVIVRSEQQTLRNRCQATRRISGSPTQDVQYFSHKFKSHKWFMVLSTQNIGFNPFHSSWIYFIIDINKITPNEW